MALTLGTRHPTEPYRLAHVKLGDYQFERSAAWEERGRLALVGMGVDPGLSDVFAAYAVKHLFDTVEEIGVRDGFLAFRLGPAQQAEAALSLSRTVLTKLALQTALDEETSGTDDRHIMFIMGTLNGQLFRDERGMPEPVFGVFDQITVKTTPK